jgi:lipoate-protein ligase A
VLFLECSSRCAAYYFSVEEFLLRCHKLDQPILMLWQTESCVMLGQYQIADAELDMNYVEERGVTIVRRPSGGGAIFTDSGTFLLSLILPAKRDSSGNYDKFPQSAARAQFADLLVGALEQLGIPARLEGRNDILVEGKKVSGMAQHVYRGRSCTHGSLLFDADLGLLASVLRVDDEKFHTKAVKSIRSRVTNIKDYATEHKLPVAAFSPPEFSKSFKQALHEITAAQYYHLDAGSLVQIEQIYREKYGNPDWVRKKTPRFNVHATRRFPAGKLEVFLEVSKGVVSACSVHGDFLGTVPIAELEEQLIGLRYQRSSFETALKQRTLSPYLGDITAEELLACVFD